MAELIVKDALNRPGFKRVAIYEVTDGLVTVVHIGDFPAISSQVGASAEGTAHLLLSDFPPSP